MPDFEVSNRSKIFFPRAGITKGDLLDYYERAAPYLLPHLEDRPLTMQRFPDGIGEKGFFQKDIPDYFPEWIDRVTVPKQDGSVTHVVCNNLDSLLYIVAQGCITLHVWLSRAAHRDCPDRMIFDLDPPEGGDQDVHQAARWMRDSLREKGLESVIQTTGSKGFHVVVPIRPEHDYSTIRKLSRKLSEDVASRHPDQLTVEHRRSKRKNRIYVDARRNSYAQTVVAPYSVRARETAPVATPVDWSELNRDLSPDRYTVSNIFRRLGQKKENPWRDLEGLEQSIEPERLVAAE